jgi:telomeric repeat-binding factor 2
LFGDRAAAEERVRELLVAEWAAIRPSRLEEAAVRLVGDEAIGTWRDADDAARAKYCILGKYCTFHLFWPIADKIVCSP